MGAGFLFVAVRRSPPAGLLPMLSAFVGTLLLLSVNDLATGTVSGERLVSHGFLVVGYLITVLLSRPGCAPGPRAAAAADVVTLAIPDRRGGPAAAGGPLRAVPGTGRRPPGRTGRERRPPRRLRTD
ncbi:hypothetical protein GCM10027614_42440 [Micromonospora vulcania]